MPEKDNKCSVYPFPIGHCFRPLTGCPLVLCAGMWLIFVVEESFSPHLNTSTPSGAFYRPPSTGRRAAPVGDAPVYAARGTVIEGESLISTARATDGPIARQSLPELHGGAQFFWQPTHPRASITIPFRTQNPGRVIFLLTLSYDYGIYQLTIDDLRAGGPVNLYSPSVVDNGFPVPDLILRPGPHILRASGSAKSPYSKSYYFGLDGIVLEPK